MCSIDKLEELAYKQLRAASDLLTVCDSMKNLNGEKDLNSEYNRLLVECNKRYRIIMLDTKFGLEMTTEEEQIWNEIIAQKS